MNEPIPFDIPPGVVKMESMGAARGRFVDCDKVRWVRGRPQKVGGWEQITAQQMLGTPRGMLGWSDGTARYLIAAGTERKLYAVPLVDFVPIDITPYRLTETNIDPLTTVNGSTSVSVHFENHNASAGDGVSFSGASSVNGVLLDGDYTITSVIDGDNFTVIAGNAAIGNGTGGGAITISLEMAPGLASPTYLFGYGVGPYGMGTYGTPREISSYMVDNRQWHLQAFGRGLLAAHSGGPLYEWDPMADPPPRASLVSGSPIPGKMNGFIVTAERIVIAWGTDSNAGAQDLLEVWTSRQGDYTDWDYLGLPNDQGAQPTLSRLAIGKKVVGGAVLGSYVNLLWTDAACYSKQYNGSANVYVTLLRGTDCGLLGPMAFAVHNGAAYWVSNSAFFMFNGAVRSIPNSGDIAEWIFTQLRGAYGVKAFASVQPRFSEIWFFFVIGNNTEPTLYAVYNIDGQFWFHGTLNRTSIALLAGQSEPIMASQDGYLFEHEKGVDADGSAIAWRLESAPFALKSYWTDVFEIEMDMQRHVGDIEITLTAYDGMHANSIPIGTQTVIAGPDDASIYPRFSGKQLAVKFDGDGVGSDFRLGIPQIHYQRGAGR